MIMKNIYKHLNKLISMCLIFNFSSCLDEDLEFGEIIVPSNISIDYEIKGVNPEDPNSIWYNESEKTLKNNFYQNKITMLCLNLKKKGIILLEMVQVL